MLKDPQSIVTFFERMRLRTLSHWVDSPSLKYQSFGSYCEEKTVGRFSSLFSMTSKMKLIWA